MSHLILLIALLLYAIVLLSVLSRIGVGLIQTVATGVATMAFVWGALYLVYASDILYTAGLVDMPASVALASVPFAWLWRYLAVHGWAVGVVLYGPIWFAAALVRILRQRPDNSLEPTAGGDAIS
jgi:hypothetical protein